MQKKFEINRTKIKDGCQSGRKVVAHNSKSDLPLTRNDVYIYVLFCSPGTKPTNPKKEMDLLSDTAGWERMMFLQNGFNYIPFSFFFEAHIYVR